MANNTGNMTNKNVGFIVDCISSIIDAFQWITINGFVRKIFIKIYNWDLPPFYYIVSEILHIILFFIPFIILFLCKINALIKTGLLFKAIYIYILWRIVSVFINQTAVLLNTDSLNGVNKNCTPNTKRLFILALLQFFELIALFAILYLIYSDHFVTNSQTSRICLSTAWQALYFSVVTVLTLGYGDITPKDDWGAFIVLMQCLFGTGMLLVIIARFVSDIKSTR